MKKESCLELLRIHFTSEFPWTIWLVVKQKSQLIVEQVATAEHTDIYINKRTYVDWACQTPVVMEQYFLQPLLVTVHNAIHRIFFLFFGFCIA